MKDPAGTKIADQPESGEIGSPNQIQAFWSRQRLELSSWFQRNAPSLGELYRGAAIMIAARSFPGRTRFVSHAVREIRNRLPDFISGIRRVPALQYKNTLDEISHRWKKTGLPLDGSRPEQFSDPDAEPQNTVSIPIHLYDRISALIRDHVDAREKPSESAERLFMGNAPGNFQLAGTLRPVVNQWLDLTEWFMKKAHDSGVIDSAVDAKELESKFELFEATLGALLRGFFTTIEELDEILEQANG
jgi:hypothetical protein